MTTRLDRLVGLLDSGATPTVRSTAARQIGGIQRQHPEELFRLLERVYSYIGSKNWDTRVAAAQAFEAIGKEVRRWDPDEIKVEGGVKVEDENEDEDEDEIGEDDDDEAELLAFAQYDVDAVIDRGRLLLGSAGKEYDDSGLEGVDAQARMALQRAQMKKRLGLGAQFLDDDVLGDEDLALDAGGGGKRRKVEEAPKEAPSKNGCDIDMGKLSARERNRIKRKARVGGRAKAGAQTQAKEETPAEQTDAKEEAQDESPRPDSLAVGARRWPFARVVARLCVDLFDAAWEVRHGAGMALREVLRTHGRGAGRIRKGGADNSARSQRALEDIAVRLVCVCTLDRFGDFVGDHVVAPVRETCAQALGVVAQFLDAAALDATLRALAALVARGALRGVWEARHAGLAALRYVAAVRRDAAPLLVRAGGLDAAVSALRDADDDVRAVAAATLLPLVATLDAVCAHRVGDVVAAAWAALPDGSDDLAASAAALLDLLARLHALPGVRAPPEHVPRLFGFLRHTAAAVRRAAVQTLRGFAAENAPGWISSACLRLVFQNIVLEADADIAELSARLWADLLRLARSGAEPLPLAPPAVAAMFGLASTPLGTPLPRALLCDAAGAAPMSGRLGADAAMVQQDFGLVPREAAVRARVMAAAALGQLMAAWPPAGRAAAFGPPLAQALQSGWALQTQLAAVVAEEFVLAERSQPLAEGAEARSQPPAEGAEALGFQALGFLSPAQPSPLPPDLAALLLAALAAEPRFRDLDRALAHVHADCAGLLESMRLHSSPAPMPPALPLLPPLPAFAIDAAEHLCAQARGDVFAGAFGERRLALAASMDSYSRQRQQLAVSAAAALAAAVVATGQLPPKLNAILRALMAAVKQEPSPLLQARAAVAAARMAALCYASAEAPRVAAADKMVRNLATFVCADPLSTPVFAQRAAQTDSIIMLEM
ncbi:TATA-binding protein-associated factor mot1, partial [Coemansia thaxteri]